MVKRQSQNTKAIALPAPEPTEVLAKGEIETANILVGLRSHQARLLGPPSKLPVIDLLSGEEGEEEEDPDEGEEGRGDAGAVSDSSMGMPLSKAVKAGTVGVMVDDDDDDDEEEAEWDRLAREAQPQPSRQSVDRAEEEDRQHWDEVISSQFGPLAKESVRRESARREKHRKLKSQEPSASEHHETAESSYQFSLAIQCGQKNKALNLQTNDIWAHAVDQIAQTMSRHPSGLRLVYALPWSTKDSLPDALEDENDWEHLTSRVAKHIEFESSRGKGIVKDFSVKVFSQDGFGVSGGIDPPAGKKRGDRVRVKNLSPMDVVLEKSSQPSPSKAEPPSQLGEIHALHHCAKCAKWVAALNIPNSDVTVNKVPQFIYDALGIATAQAAATSAKDPTPPDFQKSALPSPAVALPPTTSSTPFQAPPMSTAASPFYPMPMPGPMHFPAAYGYPGSFYPQPQPLPPPFFPSGYPTTPHRNPRHLSSSPTPHRHRHEYDNDFDASRYPSRESGGSSSKRRRRDFDADDDYDLDRRRHRGRLHDHDLEINAGGVDELDIQYPRLEDWLANISADTLRNRYHEDLVGYSQLFLDELGPR
ncbi:hypothetical protein LXA43DRAFT_1066120 [Ganoderma leucocontextum]|nr:hypothetical protein LXA43DRAFT_1066120 [Ganoderma leucocontextum]